MELQDVITFNINGKIRKIELHLGDITSLSSKEKVDLLLVSAFPNSYDPTPGTLIQSLESNLKICVGDLAKQKGEDLRSQFHCWISKKLPSKYPYKRILCFEQDFKKVRKFGRFDSNISLVGNIFRALFTTFTTDEWSLITPILASGNQRANKVKMIRAMIKACAAWLRAGMPLTCMKIVIYKSKLKTPNSKEDLQVIEEFTRLKDEMNWLPVMNEKVKPINDVLFIYDNDSQESIKLFMENFSKESNGKMVLKQFCVDQSAETTNQNEDEEVESNFDIYEDMMLQCTKVAIFLTQSFLDNSKAIEMFNLALCLTTKMQRHILIPVCINKISNLPEYMSLSQWIDCREKRVESNLTSLIIKGVKSLIEIIETDKLKNLSLTETSNDTNYDVFISYSHKDEQFASVLLSYLNNKTNVKKIFFDKSEIKLGYAWQETLYSALTNTKIFIALLSPSYFSSTVCQEEFSIALSQHYSKSFDTYLVPIWISENNLLEVSSLMEIKKFFIAIDIIEPVLNKDIRNPTPFSQATIFAICHNFFPKYISPILSKKNEISNKSSVYEIEEATRKARYEFFDKLWSTKQPSIDFLDIKTCSSVNLLKQKTLTNDVVIVYSIDDKDIAVCLKKEILEMNNNLKVSLSPIGSQGDAKNITTIESSYLIIFLLNPYFVTTKSCMLQLQIAISLQRRNNSKHGTLICPIVLEKLPIQPSFLHLLSIRFEMDDEIYGKYMSAINFGNTLGNLKANKVDLRTQTLLKSVASWVSFDLFRNDYFTLHYSPVIHSTYDLIHSGFETCAIADKSDFEKKIIPLNITNSNIDESKKIMKMIKS